MKNDEVKDHFKAKGLKEANEVLDIMRLNAKGRYGYNRYLDSLHLKASEAFSLKIKYKEEGREEGLKEGREEGLKEGIEKGLQKGIEKGVEKGKIEEKIKIAKNLLKLGIEIESIKQSTGLSKEEIEKLKGIK